MYNYTIMRQFRIEFRQETLRNKKNEKYIARIINRVRIIIVARARLRSKREISFVFARVRFRSDRVLLKCTPTRGDDIIFLKRTRPQRRNGFGEELLFCTFSFFLFAFRLLTRRPCKETPRRRTRSRHRDRRNLDNGSFALYTRARAPNTIPH